MMRGGCRRDSQLQKKCLNSRAGRDSALSSHSLGQKGEIGMLESMPWLCLVSCFGKVWSFEKMIDILIVMIGGGEHR